MSRLQTFVERVVALLKGDPAYQQPAPIPIASSRPCCASCAANVARRAAACALGACAAPSSAGVVSWSNMRINRDWRRLILEDSVCVNALRAAVSCRTECHHRPRRGAHLYRCPRRVGSGGSCGDRCALAGIVPRRPGGIHISNGVIMGPAVRVFSEPPLRRTRPADCAQSTVRAVVIIGDDCWVGERRSQALRLDRAL